MRSGKLTTSRRALPKGFRSTGALPRTRTFGTGGRHHREFDVGTSGIVFHGGHCGPRAVPGVSPINPPHLVPLVELVPAPWTAPDVVDRTEALMRQVGQVPIRLNCEIAGFVVNRLQSAVLGEAFRLVEDGICTAADVDAAISDGLGLRWFFMGPFETIDLNAQGGVADYCQKLGPMYYDLAKEQADPRPWSADLVAAIEVQRRKKTPSDQLDARKAWRDRCLAAFVMAKRIVFKEQA